LMVLVFLLLVFAIGQFVLADAISGRDRALADLNSELAELARVLSLERSAKVAAQAEANELSASLASTTTARDAAQQQLALRTAELSDNQATLSLREQELARLGN